jgi:hypothetical protein
VEVSLAHASTPLKRLPATDGPNRHLRPAPVTAPLRLLPVQLPDLSQVADPSMCSAAGAVSGAYLKATSQFPGKGPCYPVWAATSPFFNRCGCKAALAAVVALGINSVPGWHGAAAGLLAFGEV